MGKKNNDVSLTFHHEDRISLKINLQRLTALHAGLCYLHQAMKNPGNDLQLWLLYCHLNQWLRICDKALVTGNATHTLTLSEPAIVAFCAIISFQDMPHSNPLAQITANKIIADFDKLTKI